MHRDVIAFVNDALESGTPVALAILTESGRDTPGVPGAMLAVCADGSRRGTVGGGALEAKVIEDCLSALASPELSVVSFDHSLAEDGGLGMVCGGVVRGIVSVMRPEKRLIIFGGGHVGQKVYEAGLVAGFAVTVVEERREYAALFPRAEVVIAEDFGRAAGEMRITGDSYVLVATRGHEQDSAVVAALAGRGCGYLGMIGSSRKVAGMRKALLERGVSGEAVDRIYTPVGVDIDDGTPGEIAVGIMAEILAVKNGRDILRHRRDRAANVASGATAL